MPFNTAFPDLLQYPLVDLLDAVLLHDAVHPPGDVLVAQEAPLLGVQSGNVVLEENQAGKRGQAVLGSLEGGKCIGYVTLFVVTYFFPKFLSL